MYIDCVLKKLCMGEDCASIKNKFNHFFDMRTEKLCTGAFYAGCVKYKFPINKLDKLL